MSLNSVNLMLCFADSLVKLYVLDNSHPGYSVNQPDTSSFSGVHALHMSEECQVRGLLDS